MTRWFGVKLDIEPRVGRERAPDVTRGSGVPQLSRTRCTVRSAGTVSSIASRNL
jgi:hypothetical protein